MGKYDYIWKLTIIGLVVIVVGCWLMVNRYWNGIVWLADFLAYSILAYSVVVVGCGLVVIVGYTYHRVALFRLDRLRILREIDIMGYEVTPLAVNKSAVITSPGRQPVMLIHPSQDQLQLAAQPPTPNVVNVMLQFDRLLVVGGSGSGKTNLLKHYVSELVGQGAKLTIIDPHSPSKLLGIDCVGARLNFEAIEAKMIDIMLDVSDRYEAGDIRHDGDLGRDNEWVIVEEFRDIKKQLPEVAPLFMEIMTVRARKAGKRFVIVNQNDTAKSMGMEGDMDLLKACERIEISRSVITGGRIARVGWKQRDMVECEVPALWQGYPAVAKNQLLHDTPAVLTDSHKRLALAFIVTGERTKNGLYKLAEVSKNGSNSTFLDGLLKNGLTGNELGQNGGVHRGCIGGA